jgi:hypothetical protein
MHTNMDLLVLGDYLFIKDEQPPLGGSTSSKRVFEPD